MTENHRYVINIVDDKTESIDGRPMASIKDIFDKDPKAVIQVIWPDNKKIKVRKSRT